MQKKPPEPTSTKGRPPYQSTIEHFPEFAQAIGMISIEVANLEILLGQLLGALLHIDRYFGETVYLTPQANLARLAILRNVVRDTFYERTTAREHLEDLLERAEKLIGKRHQLIHNAWGLAVDNQNIVSRRSVPFKEHEPAKPVAISELTDMLASIRQLCTDVKETADEAYRHWPSYTWQEKLTGPPPGNPPTKSPMTGKLSPRGKGKAPKRQPQKKPSPE
jgi:hypothetical protein